MILDAEYALGKKGKGLESAKLSTLCFVGV